MKIFLKYVAKSMVEKKARFLLLILAIVLSTALFVGSMGAVKIGIGSFVKPQLERLENKDVYISSKSGEPVFSIQELNQKGIKNIVPDLSVSCVYDSDDMQNLNICGREEKYINKSNLIEGKELKDFSGEKCIVSKRTAEEYKLKLGDNLKLILNGEKLSLKVVAISSNKGLFYMDDKNAFQVVVPYEYISKKYGVEGKYNSVLGEKAKDSIKDSIKEFNDANTKFSAKELFNEKQVQEQMSQITSMFYLMLSIVVFMSAMIIYSSFKLTVTERLPIIGTFLSQGATRGTVRKILYLESLVYGIIGGILGDAGGVGLLYLINYLISPLKKYGIIDKPDINLSYLAFGLVFAILLSMVSAAIPVLRTSRLQVKDVILNNLNTSSEIGFGKFIIGSFLLVCVIIINSLKAQWVINFSPVLIVVAVAAIMLMFPKIIDLISKQIYRVLRSISGVNALSFNNMRTSKVLLGNVNLMILAIISIIAINSVSVSVKNVVSEAYEKLNYDIEIDVSDSSVVSNRDKIQAVVEGADGVDKDSIQFMYYANGVIKDENYHVMGIDPNKYLTWDNYLNWKDKTNEEIYNRFRDGNSNDVILSEKVAKKADLVVGDKINIKLRNTTKEYKVAGIVDGKLMNNGTFILMKYKDLPQEYLISASYSVLMDTIKSPKEVKESVKKNIKALGGETKTFEETRASNIEQNKQLMDILSIFSYMAVVIGSFGILNNIGISFIQRKRDMAVLSSVGMNKGQRARMLVIESILSVFWAAVIVTPFSYLGISIVSKITNAIGFALDVSFNLSYMPIVTGVSFLIVIIATLPVLFKSRKLSIIEELKYE